MRPSKIELFLTALLVMFYFQLQARLINYLYFFHEGILLLQAALIGSAIAILLAKNGKYGKFIRSIPYFLPMTIVVQMFLLLKVHVFVVDFVALSVVFGLFFLRITSLIAMKPRFFYTIDLLGSLVGGLILVVLSTKYLEEQLFMIFVLLYIIYTIYLGVSSKVSLLLPLALALLSIFCFSMIWSAGLTTLISCDINKANWKSGCFYDRYQKLPLESFAGLKGRSELYENTVAGRKFLTLQNNGYLVGTVSRKSDIRQDPIVYLEQRIPKLAYEDNSNILTIGSSLGGYIQSFEKYVRSPKITATEIDDTIKKMYASGNFDQYLVDGGTYNLIIEDGRRYSELTTQKFDIIAIAVDSINSRSKVYADERTSLLVTVEAFERYLDILSENGYLIVEQFYPHHDLGEQMAAKVPRSLAKAIGVSVSELEQNLLLYSWSFSPSKDSQRILMTVYKKQPLTQEDSDVFNEWMSAMKNNPTSNLYDPYSLTIEHQSGSPASNLWDVLTSEQDLKLITDDKPFRHQITTLPLPIYLYVFFIGLSIVFFLVVRNSSYSKNKELLFLSALTGFVTYGLQYLLFYKTAAVLHTNLIFFSVFLLLPILFSTVGGYFSTTLSKTATYSIVVLSVLAFVIIQYIDPFLLKKPFVVVLLAAIFIFSGVLFPLVLQRSKDHRSQLYATNLASGAVSFLLLISLHSVVGWFITSNLMLIAMIYMVWRLRML